MVLHRSSLALSLCVSLAACGGESSSTAPFDAALTPADKPAVTDSAPSDTTTPSDASMDSTTVTDAAPIADPCTPFCARLVGAMGCMRDTPTCMRDCATQIAATPAVCRGALNAYFACAIGSTATCTGAVSHFAGCDDAQTALVLCAAMPPDAGSDPCARKIDCASCVAISSCGWCNGHCLPGDSTGPTPPVTCGGTTWVRSASSCL